ncbi:hypothetical protein ACFLIM_33160 [Nonomuraea sp. M3C6]|uniref:Uncharacterized protein n=1 Tax=Nonomuraea marmarensis TaxID=3351344 RepID=A0ABW7AL12_9ACTN
MSAAATMLRGDTVYRVHWKPGTDLLVGVCHCGAAHDCEDPVELWNWLLAHPDGHRPLPASQHPAA